MSNVPFPPVLTRVCLCSSFPWRGLFLHSLHPLHFIVPSKGVMSTFYFPPTFTQEVVSLLFLFLFPFDRIIQLLTPPSSGHSPPSRGSCPSCSCPRRDKVSTAAAAAAIRRRQTDDPRNGTTTERNPAKSRSFLGAAARNWR